jgi:PAS domain S-box-containing protein
MIAIVSGPDHVFEFANPAYLELVGRREVVGKRVRDVLPELDEQGTVALLDRVYATGEPFIGRRMPVAFQRQANAPAETRYMDFVYQPVVDDQGQVTGIFAQGFDITRQVRTETAFDESEARYRLFSEETREGVVVHNGEVILDCNPAYARIFGYGSVAEVIGLPSTAFVTPRSAALLLEKGALDSEEPYEIEAIRKDGSVFPAEFVGRPSTWQGRKVRIGLARDLTERKRREAALRESEAHFAAIFDQSAAGFGEVDLTGRFLRVNDRFCEISGYTREELLNGRRMQDITHPDDLPENVRLFQHAVESGKPFEIEKRYIRPDGSEVWVSNTVTLIRGEMGPPTIASVSIDLTARREAEAALRQSESRLRLALDAGRMAVWESDSRTNSVTTSPELNRLLGFPEDASPSIEEIRDRYAPGAQDRLRAAAAAALARGERNAEEELEIIWPDGSRHWLLLRADLEVVTGEDGAVSIKAMGVAFEITERKLWEERQRLLINELNHRVKNTLATVQSIALQSFRRMDAATGSNVVTAFQDRLFALARAHDILTRDNWEGAELRDIVGEVIEPYCRQSSGRCDIDGPRVRLTPSMALALSMAVHELATNAAKYGALSVSEGQVSISWSVIPGEPRQLILCWQERGGPPVVLPQRKGFGTRLIERSLAQELAGEVSLAYVPTGVVCTIKAPLPEGIG